MGVGRNLVGTISKTKGNPNQTSELKDIRNRALFWRGGDSALPIRRQIRQDCAKNAIAQEAYYHLHIFRKLFVFGEIIGDFQIHTPTDICGSLDYLPA